MCFEGGSNSNQTLATVCTIMFHEVFIIRYEQGSLRNLIIKFHDFSMTIYAVFHDTRKAKTEDYLRVFLTFSCRSRDKQYRNDMTVKLFLFSRLHFFANFPGHGYLILHDCGKCVM